jgi:hypothetical protein
LPERVFWVPGKPRTAGSKSAVPITTKDGGSKTVVIESGTKQSRQAKRTYRGDLRDAAARAIDAVDDPRAEDGLARLWPTDRALEVVFVFVMRRPGAHLRTGWSAGEVKPWALQVRPTVRPDAVKLARAAEDALTGVVWVDDSQIVDERLGDGVRREGACGGAAEGGWDRRGGACRRGVRGGVRGGACGCGVVAVRGGGAGGGAGRVRARGR